jgi:hypothetical protein
MTHKGRPEAVFVAIATGLFSIQVMQFVTLVKRNKDDPGFIREPTPANIEAEITKARIPALYWWIIDPASLPQDRTFRNAWKDEGSRKIAIDMPRAREIHMDRIRIARDAKLEETDKLVARLDGAAVPEELKAQRQKLRDIPQTLDLSKCETIEQLKAAVPDELK